MNAEALLIGGAADGSTMAIAAPVRHIKVQAHRIAGLPPTFDVYAQAFPGVYVHTNTRRTVVRAVADISTDLRPAVRLGTVRAIVSRFRDEHPTLDPDTLRVRVEGAGSFSSSTRHIIEALTPTKEPK